MIRAIRSLATLASLAGLCMFAVPRLAEAQLGYIVSSSVGNRHEGGAVGAGLRLRLGSGRYRLETTVDRFRPSGAMAHHWQANAIVVRYRRGDRGTYYGGGVHYAYRSNRCAEACDLLTDRTAFAEMGYAVVLGRELSSSRIRPFVQSRVEFGGGGQVTLGAGVRF